MSPKLGVIELKKQTGTPEILKKSHAHQSDKDYSRKNTSDWFDEYYCNRYLVKDNLLSSFSSKGNFYSVI